MEQLIRVVVVGKTPREEERRVKRRIGKRRERGGSIFLCISQSEKCRLDDRTCAALRSPPQPHKVLRVCVVCVRPTG